MTQKGTFSIKKNRLTLQSLPYQKTEPVVLVYGGGRLYQMSLAINLDFFSALKAIEQ